MVGIFRSRRRKATTGDGIASVVVGTILLAVCLWTIFTNHTFRQNGLEATAKIIEIQDRSSRHHDVYVRFYTETGREVITELEFYVSTMEVGQELTVFYDPTDPQNMLSVWDMMFFPAMDGGVGLLLLSGIGILTKRLDSPVNSH